VVRWFALEFLPLRIAARASDIAGAVCRFVGCGVALGVLSVEIQMRAMAHGVTVTLLWFGSALTALFIGNFVREWMFAFCSRVANLCGYAFRRRGVTLGGQTFSEICYPKGTWLRCECGATGASYEWTQPDGSCNRVEVLLGARAGRKERMLPPVVRVVTAPGPRLGPDLSEACTRLLSH